MRDIMIDIETLDTLPTAKMLSIGACRFDMEFKNDSMERIMSDAFYMNIAVEDYDRYPGVFTESQATLDWWSKQSDAAINILSVDARLIHHVLSSLSAWIRKEPFEGVWANSPEFDLSIIGHHYRMLKIQQPWIFRDQRDQRTIIATAKRKNRKFSPEYPHNMVAHNALHDAAAQALIVQQAYQSIAA